MTRRVGRLAACIVALAPSLGGHVRADDAPAPPDTAGPPSGTTPSAPPVDDVEPPLRARAVAPAPTRRDGSPSAVVVDGDEYRALPRRTPEDALRLVPGLVLVQHGAEGKAPQLLLRGFDASHGADFAVEVEGIPLNEGSNVHSHGYLDFGLVIPELVASVDVVRGPYTIWESPFATAGAATYRMGSAPDRRGFGVSLTGGTTNRERVVASYVGRGGGSFVAAESTRDDGFGSNRAFDRQVFNARYVVRDEGDRGRIVAFVAAHRTAFELPGAVRDDDVRAGRVDFDGTYDVSSGGRSERVAASIQATRRRGGRRVVASGHVGVRRLLLRENATGWLIDAIHGDRRAQQQSTARAGGAIELRAPLAGRVELLGSAGVLIDAFEQLQRPASAARGTDDVDRSLSGVGALAHISLGVRYAPVRALTIDAGARLDLAGFGLDDRLDAEGRFRAVRAAGSPRVRLEYRPSSALHLGIAYGRGVRPPEARAFTGYTPPVTGVGSDAYRGGVARMTTSDSAEVSARYRPHRMVSAGVGVFASRIDRETVYDHASGLTLELDTTRRTGAEFDVEFRPCRALLVRGDVTVVDARFTASGRPVPYVPRVVGGGRVLMSHPSGVRGGLRLLAFTPRPLPNGARGAAYASVDASVSFVRGPIAAELEVENVFDRRQREGEYHYASDFQGDSPLAALPALHVVAGPPRVVRLTLSARFGG